ncbi:MAG: FliM/FliN family flagellar motor switch protein [Bacillota bacterium]
MTLANISEEQIRSMLNGMADNRTQIRKVKLAPFTANGVYSSQPDMKVFQGLKIDIFVELSNTTMTLREVLSLEEGHLISLEKLAGEPVDVKFDGEAFAKGEVVVINELFGIRITSLIENGSE